jgi:endonuclease YncB( thermonuclease family)
MGKTEFGVLLVGLLILFFYFQGEQVQLDSPVSPAQSQEGKLYGQSVVHSFQVFNATAVDGDSIRFVDAKGAEVDLRLASIDAPEWNQAFGDQAKSALSSMLGQGVTLNCFQVDTDRWQRAIVFVVATSAQGQSIDVNATLVSEGLAWHAVKHSDDPTLEQLQQQARSQRRGLWAENNPLPPWEFRSKR